MKEIRLYGELGRRFGRVHRMAVSSVGEAIRALCVNFKGFESAFLEVAPAYRVWNGVSRVAELEQVGLPSGTQDVIRIAPAVSGAGKDGLGSVLLGAALIAAAFFLPTAPLFAFGGFAPSLASISFNIGMSLALGGISQMLSSTPNNAANSGEAVNNQPSYVFNGPINTTAQGNPVPVGYGRLIVGSAVISAGIAAEDIA